MEIALGDNHGKEIHFTYSVWKKLLDQRDAIHHFFNNNEDEAYAQTIRQITLWFGKINNLKVLRLETSTLCLAMSSNTVYNMNMLSNIYRLYYSIVEQCHQYGRRQVHTLPKNRERCEGLHRGDTRE